MARRSLKDSVVVITGASSGIGKELAIQLAQRQTRLILNARREERLRKLATEIEAQGSSVACVIGDITDRETQESIRDVATSKFNRMDVLVNNAGVGAIGRFEQASEERMRKIMELNFFAPVELTRRSLPLLRESSAGIVVNVSSVLGHRAVPLKSEYCASKFAIHGWSDSLRAELAKDGIDVLLVSPSTTDSEFFDSVLEDASGKNPKLGTPMPPDVVARKTIRAIERGKSEIILSAGGKALVWLDRICPPLANLLMRRFAQ